MQTFFCPAGYALFNVNSQHILEKLTVVAYGTAHILTHRCIPVDGLRDGDQGYVVSGQGRQRFQSYSGVPGPPVQGMTTTTSNFPSAASSSSFLSTGLFLMESTWADLPSSR